MHDFFICEAECKARVDVVATTSYNKLVVDMHYEARIQAIISYHGSVLGEKVTKQQAQTMSLTRDKYLQVNTTL
jgi:quinolinate synthase